MRLETREKVPGHVDLLAYGTPEQVVGWVARLSRADGVVKVWPPQVDSRGRAFAVARRRLPRPPAVRPTPRTAPSPQWGQVRRRVELRAEHVLPLTALAAGLAGVGVVVWLVATAVSGAARWTAANGELLVGVLAVVVAVAVGVWLTRRPARVPTGSGGHRCSGRHCASRPGSR